MRNNLTSNVNTLEKRKVEYENNVEELNEQIKTLISQQASCEEVVKQFTINKDNLSNEIKTLSEDKAKYGEVAKQLEKIQDNVAEAEKLLKTITAEKVKTEQALAANQAKIDAMKSNYTIAEENLALSLEHYADELAAESESWQAQAVATYLTVQKELQEQVEELMVSILQKQSELGDLQRGVQAAINERKRAAEEAAQVDFYRIVIPEEDLQEIEELRTIIPRLRNPEPINKVIWKYYYEKPTNAMIGRVLGRTEHTGIYKITNIHNGMCYVGQALSTASRWKQHIKRGLGAETPTKNNLYPAMAKEGVENFTFELIEECPSEQLDAKEDFWQQYFGAIEYGYSIK